jgi:alpha-galactosidase
VRKPLIERETKMKQIRPCPLLGILMAALVSTAIGQTNPPPATREIRTPKPSALPRINGPGIFGVRPGSPFQYHIPATGERPIQYSADHLPPGLKLDPHSGNITGTVKEPGEHTVTLRARNSKGDATKQFKIVVGEEIALTPPLGWNSWNCWGPMVDEQKVRKSAHAMVDSGLIDHGWTYINIDDAWQGKRGGPLHAIQPNEKFPDLKGLSAEVHRMGLKLGIYSTPWITSYAGYVGGSADHPEGAWPPPGVTNFDPRQRLLGTYSFAENDAKQWGAWGIDYLKYDWNPRNTSPAESAEQFHKDTATMAGGLRKSGRDILFSYSNSMPFERIADQSQMFNCWRTTGDIGDTWWSVTRIGFNQDKWAPYARPGHWNDPDMLVVGYVDVGKGRNLHPTRLTSDEQYTHITLWSLLAAPMLIGCDMSRLDDFSLNLLSNDEVLAIDQDTLGKQAVPVSQTGDPIKIGRPDRPGSESEFKPFQVWARPLEDGSQAVGLFNLGNQPAKITVKWVDLKLSGKLSVRDVWRQKDLGQFDDEFSVTVAPHGAELVKIK